MKMDQPIPLAQKIYFLGIHPEKGGIRSGAASAMHFVVIGTLLMDLYLQKKIKFEGKRVIVLSTKSDNELHRFVLDKMSRAKSPKKISTWISKLNYSQKYIRSEVQKGLVAKRLIRLEEKQFLFFKWKKPVVLNKQVMYRMIAEIDKQIFKGTTAEEELIFLSFLEPAAMLRLVYQDRRKRKQARARLKQMSINNRVSGAVADAIAASQAIAASVAASAAASAATNH
ncbi:Golgi phosphoprotein 3 (GPP34) [Draconibacterium orientale]|uniref:Golgi phosphoprotein 3 (GPP34) n=2 Tax=Draconibacterium orientale TaxID=1168034 RepID=A0A1I0IW70_9BACT|nr:GPP34 family phosphoprotein [Draconibacterium orientale]SEU01635.1 Golgi phosphoprotein 3 (GPP34) [Draconibacterium orientale]